MRSAGTTIATPAFATPTKRCATASWHVVVATTGARTASLRGRRTKLTALQRAPWKAWLNARPASMMGQPMSSEALLVRTGMLTALTPSAHPTSARHANRHAAAVRTSIKTPRHPRRPRHPYARTLATSIVLRPSPRSGATVAESLHKIATNHAIAAASCLRPRHHHRSTLPSRCRPATRKTSTTSDGMSTTSSRPTEASSRSTTGCAG